MGYPNLQFPPPLILLILCLYLTISAGEILDHQPDPESEEFLNSLPTNIRNDNRNGFVELLNFMNSINNTITDLKGEIGLQRTEIVDQKGKMESQEKQIQEFKQAVRNLYKLKSNLSWEDFDEFIRSIETEVKTGNSFNGSTLPQIKSRASQVGQWGSYTVVVFANHMDEAIQDFKIHDPYYYTNNPAPKSIPPHTQEIFTFAKPSNSYVEISFSYFIPSARVRIAVMSTGGVLQAGLTFISNDANMKTYYNTLKGIEGSWVYESKERTDQNLSVSYKNFQARLFAKYEGERKATLRIELIKFPL